MRYLFIVSYGRSGSTLLQRILNSCEGVCIRGENYDTILHFAKAWSTLSDNQEFRKLKNSKTVPFDKSPWFGIQLVDEEALGARLADLFVEEILRPPEGTRVCGFKEIRWIRELENFEARISFIKRFFPSAKFIINTRDLDQVSRSGWWKMSDRGHVIERLSSFEEKALEWKSRNEDICYHIRYDDYINNLTALRPMFDFAELPFDRNAVNAILRERLTH